MSHDKTYVDSPELLNAVKADDLLQKLVPVLLSARRLGEPEGPCVLQLVLDVEVRRVIEDGDNLGLVLGFLLLAANGGDGNGVERHGLRGLRGGIGHVCGVAGGGRFGWVMCA
jgi:hypothetical protein